MHVHTNVPGRLDQQRDDVRIELGEWTRAAMHDVDLRARSGSNVCEFEGDATATDEHDPGREMLEIEELGACGQVLFAGNVQCSVPRSARDHDVAADQRVVAHLQSSPVDEARTPMHHANARLGEAPLVLLGHWMVSPAAGTPLLCMRRFQSTSSAPPTSTFLGSHPRS